MSLIDDFYMTSDRIEASDYAPIRGHAQTGRRAAAERLTYPSGLPRIQEIPYGNDRRARAH